MQLNQYIEHTLLKVDCVQEDIIHLMEEAHQHQFYGVCIPPCYVLFANSIQQNVRLVSVVGFPLGYQNYETKCAAINNLAKLKVNEVDVVTNIATIKNKAWVEVQQEWEALILAAQNEKLTIKIIIESGLLDEEELIELCAIANKLKPDFIKTSTGFNGVGAEPTKVAFLRKHLDDSIQIKASGGIKNAAQAKAFIEAGATRIGTSSGVRIVGSALK